MGTIEPPATANNNDGIEPPETANNNDGIEPPAKAKSLWLEAVTEMGAELAAEEAERVADSGCGVADGMEVMRRTLEVPA